MMYIHLLKQSKPYSFFLGLLLLATGLPVAALESDKDQPIEVEADAGELDDLKNISIYTGNVITIQGTIRMTGDKMTVYYTADDEIDYLIMEGRPATYKQLPDDSSVYDYAEALTMKYYEQREYVILIDEALVTQEGLRFTGDRIEYDTRLSQVKAWSNKDKTTTAAEDKPPEQKQRVKIIIKKKKDRCGDSEYIKTLDENQLIIFNRECEKKKLEKENGGQ